MTKTISSKYITATPSSYPGLFNGGGISQKVGAALDGKTTGIDLGAFYIDKIFNNFSSLNTLTAINVKFYVKGISSSSVFNTGGYINYNPIYTESDELSNYTKVLNTHGKIDVYTNEALDGGVHIGNGYNFDKTINVSIDDLSEKRFGVFLGIYEIASVQTLTYEIKNLNLSLTYDIKCYVTFKSEGSTDRVIVCSGGTVPSYNITRDGYRFVGWSDGSKIYTDTLPATNEYDVVYTAVWEKNTYSLTVNINDNSMGRVTIYKNNIAQQSNTVEYIYNDVCGFKIEANSGFIVSSLSSSEGNITMTAKDLYDANILNKPYTILDFPSMTITENMLGMNVTMAITLISGSVVYTMNLSSNNTNLGNVELYIDGAIQPSNIAECYAGEKITIKAQANVNSFIYNIVDTTNQSSATYSKEELKNNYQWLDILYKNLNIPETIVKNENIGETKHIMINFTPGVDIWFGNKKAIELYYEDCLADGAYFENIKL